MMGPLERSGHLQSALAAASDALIAARNPGFRARGPACLDQRHRHHSHFPDLARSIERTERQAVRSRSIPPVGAVK